MKAVVAGYVATYPLGGVAWDYGQYALGLERMGFEVYYIEDTGQGEYYHPGMRDFTADYSHGLEFLQLSLAALSPSLAQRWHHRALDGQTHGIDAETMRGIIEEADVFLNVSGACLLREEYMPCRRKVLIDTDPAWNHFVEYAHEDRRPPCAPVHSFRDHDYFFTYAERMGRAGCRLPDLGIAWQPTRPPVVLDAWSRGREGGHWTTVMTWRAHDDIVADDGVVYGAKDVQFDAVESLPARVSTGLEIAVGHLQGPVDRLRDLGWSVVDAVAVSRTTDSYRRYIQDSRGEFSVAKHAYVGTRSGWSSCRSVCYLASSRPVVLEDTGFPEVIPSGDGLLAFSDLDSAVRAIAEVERRYEHHAEAARDVATSHFDSDTVLAGVLDRASVGG